MKNLRSKVMTIAHQIKGQFKSWSKALKAAWKIAKMYFGQRIIIEFAKSSGEVRTAEVLAIGSLSTIKKGFVRFVEETAHGTTQWRSFRIEKLILN